MTGREKKKRGQGEDTMPSIKTARLVVVALVAVAVSAGYVVGRSSSGILADAQEVSPTKASPRDFYVPNSEDLAPDEMRVIACGTGMPTTRAAQAAACFLVELGNGDKFLFDVGSGSAERISSLQIPYDYLDKIFLSHLHGDHFGSLGELYIGGSLMGRHVPLRIWGPSGAVPELGTAYAVQKMEEMYTWDVAGRLGVADVRGINVEVHEFDYTGVNQVVYDVNGVVIRSWPAIHAIDGPVSLAWSGTASSSYSAVTRTPTSGSSSTPRTRTWRSTSALSRRPISWPSWDSRRRPR